METAGGTASGTAPGPLRGRCAPPPGAEEGGESFPGRGMHFREEPLGGRLTQQRGAVGSVRGPEFEGGLLEEHPPCSEVIGMDRSGLGGPEIRAEVAPGLREGWVVATLQRGWFPLAVSHVACSRALFSPRSTRMPCSDLSC